MADAKTPADAPAAAAPEPKKKPWLMIVIIVAVLAAGGGGAAFFMGGKDDKAAQAEGKGKNGKKDAHKEPAQFVKLDPPFVVNFESKGLMRFLQVTVEVMTRDLATVEALKQHDPMIRNDLILMLGNQPYEAISTREGKEQLRAEALKVVARIIDAEGGDGKKVEQLYFTSFVMQ
jgi:flagellar FliL protein